MKIDGAAIGIRASGRIRFDADAILAKLDKTERNVLARQGGYVRKVAKQSMRRRKKTSRPGQTPTVRTGALKRFLEFAYDSQTHSVVIGPIIFVSPKVPDVLEFGGSVKAPRVKFAKPKLGGTGPLRVSRGEGEFGTKVHIGKLKTPAQVRRAADLIQELEAAHRDEDILIEPRPYMRPAFEKSTPVIVEFWKDAIQ